jgi:hypothetical protein
MASFNLGPIIVGSDGSVRRYSDKDVYALFSAETERAVLAMALNTGNQMSFYDHDDATRILHARQFTIHDQGGHFGDCTSFACSCARCLSEMAYETALEFETAVNQQLDPLVLALATEDQCDTYELLSAWKDVHPEASYRDFVRPDTSVAARLRMWDALHDDAKNKARDRAAQWRQWYKVKMPDYPDTWPDH